MPELSVIVPVYNVEDYLERCIRSILTQTFTDFELILVNDGSPDCSEGIMKMYAEKDKRIINIFRENKGVSAARNAGLAVARGKYISFIDPDDYIEKDMYEKLLPPMREDVGLSVCNWDDFKDEGYFIAHEMTQLNSVMDKEYVLSHYFDMPRPMSGSVCNKLFVKEEILTKFDEKLIIEEDVLFLFQYLISMKKNEVVFCDSVLYHVCARQNSTTRQNSNRMALGLKAELKALDITKKYDQNLTCLAERKFLDTAYGFLLKLKNQHDNEYYRYAREMFIEYMDESWTHMLRNPSIYYKTKALYMMEFLKMTDKR